MPSRPLPSPRLLRADEVQLDRAARLLLDGSAFLIIVAATELRSTALVHLRQHVPSLSLPETPVTIGSAHEALEALTEQAARRDQVLSLQLGPDTTGALEGLNWHREKLLQGAPVILWLQGEQEMRLLREVAPDAYSFRTSLLHLQGNRQAPLDAPEPADLSRYRRHLQRARTPLERAGAGGSLAQELRLLERLEEADRVVRRALDGLPDQDDEQHLTARARLEREMTSIQERKSCLADSYRWCRRSLATLRRLPLSGSTLTARIHALAVLPGSAGRDLTSVAEALRLGRSLGAEPEAMFTALRGALQVALALGDTPRAQRLLEEARLLEAFLDPYNQGLLPEAEAAVERTLGHSSLALDKFEEASGLLLAGGYHVPFLPHLLVCWLERGELEQAESLLAEHDDHLSLATRPKATYLAWLLLARGSITEAVRSLHQAIEEAANLARDETLDLLTEQLIAFLVEANDVEPLTATTRDQALGALSLAETTSLRLAGQDGPPWYGMQYLGRRARLLCLSPETLDEGLALGQQASERARQSYPDLVPELGRSQADSRRQAGQHDHALALIADLEPEAARRGFLRERARLLATRVLVLADRGEELTPAVAAWRGALTAMAAPRLTAEMVLDLIRRLPPATTALDVAALAEEAHRLFAAIPMPAQDARAQEIMGDALAARGRTAEARRRYQSARRRLEQHGLALRLPLLDRKLAALTPGIPAAES